jgi:hypothetical protein
LTAVVLLPTPPLPEATAMMFFTPGSGFKPRCTVWATILTVTLALTLPMPGDRPQFRDHGTPDLVDLGLRGITQFDVERDIDALDLDVSCRAGRKKILPGIRVDQFPQCRLHGFKRYGHSLLLLSWILD